MLSYSADQLCALNRDDRPPSRAVRKAIFSQRLWFPRWRHSSRIVHGSGTRRYARSGGPNLSCNRLSFGLLNANSVTDRSTAISDVITTEQLDVMAITETWHRASTDVSLKRCAPTGYAIIDVPRPSRAGGVALPAVQQPFQREADHVRRPADEIRSRRLSTTLSHNICCVRCHLSTR